MERGSSLQSFKTQTSDLTQDQTRIRADIDSLNRVKGQEEQVRNYSDQLAANEVELAKLRDHRRELELRKTDLDSQVRKAMDSLQF